MSDRVYAQVVDGRLEIYPVPSMKAPSFTTATPQDRHDQGTPALNVYLNEQAARHTLIRYCINTDRGGGRKSRRYNKKRSTRVNRKGSKRSTRRSRRVMQRGG